MKFLYMVTSNQNKVVSARRVLSKYGISVKHKSMEIPEPRSYDEKEIASAKVLYAYKQLGKPCIVTDSGFFIHSINGFPRTFVHFALDTIGIEGIIKLAEKKGRTCDFRNCLAYYDGNKEAPTLFESRARGMISVMPRGTTKSFHWSKLFLIFLPDGERKTLGEITKKEYLEWHRKIDRYSHLEKFGKWFSSKN